MKQQLSKEQEIIVNEWTSNGGAMIVEASAGSGKTRVLTESVRKILEETPREKFRILCLTFTVKAAEEMKERLQLRSSQKERTFISNLHTFALNILKHYKHELGYQEMPHIIENIEDRKSILNDVFNNIPDLKALIDDLDTVKQKNTLINETLQLISEQKRNLVFLDDDTFEHEDFDDIEILLYKNYNEQLKNQNLIDFDDMLLLAWRILSEKPQVAKLYQRLYKYVLIDEGQDLNFAQYELIKVLCGKKIKNILMIGDESQTIHGFAGADKKYMFEFFKNDFAAFSREIKKNYRSSKKVLQTANLIIPNKLLLSENQFFDGEAKSYEFKEEEEEATFIINKIKEALTWNSDEFEGQVTLDKIAVLARNRFIFNPLKKALDNDETLKNRYYLKQSTNVLVPESTFMKVFDLGTRVITNPNGQVYLKSLYRILKIREKNIYLNGLRSKGGVEILTYLKNYFDETTNISKKNYEFLITIWENLNKGIHNLTKILDDLESYTNSLDENERKYALLDIREWKLAWKKYIRSSSANQKSLADFKRFIVMGYTRERNDDGLTLATVHTVKGLEYDIVFLIGMCEGTFPDYRATTEKALNEEKNNAYVAVTRAKRHIYISYPKNKMMPWGSIKRQRKSRFIKAIFEKEILQS